MRISNIENDCLAVSRVWKRIESKIHDDHYVIFDNFMTDENGILFFEPNISLSVVMESRKVWNHTAFCDIYLTEKMSHDMREMLCEINKNDMDMRCYMSTTNPQNKRIFDIVSKYIGEKIPNILNDYKCRTLMIKHISNGICQEKDGIPCLPKYLCDFAWDKPNVWNEII